MEQTQITQITQFKKHEVTESDLMLDIKKDLGKLNNDITKILEISQDIQKELHDQGNRINTIE